MPAMRTGLFFSAMVLRWLARGARAGPAKLKYRNDQRSKAFNSSSRKFNHGRATDRQPSLSTAW